MRALLFLLVSFFTVSFTACTCSSGCSTTEAVQLAFEGYSIAELDSIILERFDAGTLFTSKADERFLAVDPNAGANEMLVTFSLRKEYDYRITVLSDSNQFVITDIEDNQAESKGRGLCLAYTKEARVCPLESINLTGNKVSSTSNTNIVLRK